jgi:dTDP-4-dehydrorhamnose reductase
MSEVKPDVVINAAAYTAVDKAEQEPALAAAINADAVGELGCLAAQAGIPVIHYSTDFVFDGSVNRPYREDDRPAPLSVYGQTKLAGEQALASSGANYLVFRTAWVYGVRGANFMLTMRRLFVERNDVRVVADQTGAPTWSRMLAEATATILTRMLHGGLDLESVKGVYHMTAGGSTSWFGFARAILESHVASCRLTPIPSSEYPTPARRPAYSVLDNGKLERSFGITLPDWDVSLTHCLEDLNPNAG